MSFPASKSNLIKPRKPHTKVVKGFRPQMTSLIDIMTILLVFLVKSFSAEGNVMNIPRDIALPVSSAKKPAKPAVMLSVSKNFLVVDGEYLAPVPKIIKSRNLMIEPLYNWLEQRRNLTEKIAEYSTRTEFKGEIAIQGDKKIPFRLIQKIMFTCGQVGYNNFSLAVIQEE